VRAQVLVPVPDFLHAKIKVEINKTEIAVPVYTPGKLSGALAKIQARLFWLLPAQCCCPSCCCVEPLLQP
jgi:hypothetical protein